jgi:NAD(P)-dependent dehydrogenase (short-subunit alcohol dehydrogenase family)
MTVYASARRLDTLVELAKAGLRTVALDVTVESSMRHAVARIEAECGAVDVLVNNAGYGLSGTVEETSAEAVHDQFETNVFGPIRLTQLILPGMRRQGSGTIVNLSSIFGRYSVPGGGCYHATKHAIEALSDALRLEVDCFGIRVMLIEPGPVLTEFGGLYVAAFSGADDGPYGEFCARAAKYYELIYSGTRRSVPGALAVTSDDVAQVIERALASSHPRARYPVGLLAHSTIMLRRLLSDRLFDHLIVRRPFPVPRAEARHAALTSAIKGATS